MNPCETILEVGGEGGSITLYGLRTATGWLFSREVIDQTPELINEAAIQHESEIVDSWPAALKLMSCYPWMHLYPLKAHPEFRESIFTAATAPSEDHGNISDNQLGKWQRVCGLPRC